MSDKAKDTIYIDVDEEITGIVSKVTSSEKNIVALVLPKRAAVLQSIVNMKLLKRTADQNNKKVVLITGESRILPLAGAAGLFVAPNLTSKPYVPLAPLSGSKSDEVDPNTPLSQVAPDAKFAPREDEVEIDNTKKEPVPPIGSSTAKKADKAKKPKVPNFSSFRKKIIIAGIILVLLIAFLIYALIFAPKATISFKAQTKEIPTSLDFIADSKTDELDTAGKVVRATKKEIQKNDSEKVPATGQKDEGNKASGTVSLKNCADVAGEVTIPAGSAVTSGDLTYVTSQAVTLPQSFFGGGPNKPCFTPPKDVALIAQKPGEQYNLSAGKSYTVSGRSGISGSGSAMSGGTSKIVKVVTQGDVEKAKERLRGKQNTTQEEIKQELSKDGYLAIEDSFKAKLGSFSPSPGVDSEATEVSVSVTNSYTMLGVKEEDLKKLVEEAVKNEQQGQSILNDGLGSATFKLNPGAGGTIEKDQTAINLQTKVIAGPDINQDQLKSELAGKKSGEAEEILKQKPGLAEPKIELKPFWVTKIPKKQSKITIEIHQADGSLLP